LARVDRWHIVAVLKPATMSRQRKWDESKTAKEFKVVKLPRNGPKEGQSADAWLHGKTKGGDAEWEKRRAKAITEGRL